MAELALGAIEVAIRPRTRPGVCLHQHVLTVVACGVERTICEICGHIGVSFVSEVTGPVTRQHFARPADEGLDDVEELLNPFADQTRLELRRRESPDRRSLLLLTA
ncbi:MAG TPA: hypothetical protein VI141_07825 [Acidimicrobiia bacterium]